LARNPRCCGRASRRSRSAPCRLDAAKARHRATSSCCDRKAVGRCRAPPDGVRTDLSVQGCQCFERLEDLDSYACTIEEREEYEAHIEQGQVVHAGVDYAEILQQAERECDIILWDGGNKDLSFFRTDLHIVLVDLDRAGHDISYYAGETSLRMARVVVVAKSGNARDWNDACIEKGSRCSLRELEHR
jgi:predicted GTPase